jgi:hypothetical protein
MSFANTILNDAIAKRFSVDKYENRPSQYGGLEAHSKSADKLMPASTIEALKLSSRQVTKVPVLNKYGATVVTSRTCVPTPDSETSDFLVLTYATVGFNVGISPSVNNDNYISVEDSLGHQMEMGYKAVFTSLDASSIANLETARSQTHAGSATAPYTFDAVNFNFDVPADGQVDMYKNIPAIMERNDLQGRYQVIGNTEAQTLPLNMVQQGAGNSENLAYAVADSRYDFNLTNRIVPGGGIAETLYVVPEGNIGVYNWIDVDSRMGNKIHESNLWTTRQDPMFGFDWGVRYIADCADKSAQSAGLEATFTQAWQFTADFAFVTAYSSDVSSPIYKFEVAE